MAEEDEQRGPLLFFRTNVEDVERAKFVSGGKVLQHICEPPM
jgi:hypothetical protein